MGTKAAIKQDTKNALLQAGMDFMLEKGYTNTGVQLVLSSLGVPKGSFYHYFESKEAFAVSIIHQFDQEYSTKLLRVLKNPLRSPLQRLRDYCEAEKDEFERQQCRKGCLIGNLSKEMSDQSSLLRDELANVMAKWRGIFGDCIEEGQQLGEIIKKVPAQRLAEFFCIGWGGAVFRATTLKSIEPMEIFIDLMFNEFLKE
jgi:TetR/AcrR family transcriptional regulator, transcriptional repressor for nem operon